MSSRGGIRIADLASTRYHTNRTYEVVADRVKPGKKLKHLRTELIPSYSQQHDRHRDILSLLGADLR
jgi:hypothetical protein